MGGVEGQEPVAQRLEKGEGLQVGEGGDEHVTAFDLHGVEFLDALGDAALVQPLLPVGIGLHIAQVDDLRILVLEFLKDIGTHLHDVGYQVFADTVFHIFGVARASQLQLDAPHVLVKARSVEHGCQARLDSLGPRDAFAVGEHRQHGAGQGTQFHLRVIADGIYLQKDEQFALIVVGHQSQQQCRNEQATGVYGKDVAREAQLERACIIGRQRE